MNQPIVLRNRTPDGEELEAVFQPSQGMTLSSYRRGKKEVIDGLGLLVGPHFGERRPDIIPQIKEIERFSHVAGLKARGIADPFFGGIGRYAPWTVQGSSETKIQAVLTGKDVWEGVALSALEGQNFRMTCEVELKPAGLAFFLSVVSDSDSVVGLEYPYALPNGNGRVVSDVRKQFYRHHELQTIPSDWNYDSQGFLTYDLSKPGKSAFLPFLNPLAGKVVLETPAYNLNMLYQCVSQENSWYLERGEKDPQVTLGPISSQNPWRPNLTVSSLTIQLQIA